ncbi:MAG: putative polyprenyl diphosphate synthase [Pseudonocardiales bacterium]|nr:putative polyprenyl diphosphate synthase [Pseudonocardiales bacterium]
MTSVQTDRTRSAPPGWALSDRDNSRIDEAMLTAISGLTGPLRGSTAELITSGGKRLRPALTIAIATLGGRNWSAAARSDLIKRAAAVELLHCATLVHDDIIDRSTVRRGRPSVNASQGTAGAVVSGDMLIAAACTLAGRASQSAGILIAETLGTLCQGEAMEDQLRFDDGTSIEALLRVARLKTGSLIQTAGLLGAEAVGLDHHAGDAITRFGMDLGVTLQLVDDILDLVSSEELAGKPVGVDFACGTVTLPAAYALRGSAELRSLLRPGLDYESQGRALTLLRTPDPIRTAVSTALKHAMSAGAALRSIAEGNPLVTRLAEWPAEFVRTQLATKVEPRFEHLISGAVPDVSAERSIA